MAHEKLEALVSKGESLFREGNVTEAKHCFEDALAIDKRNATALNNLGAVAYQNREIGQAFSLFSRAVEANPDSCDALLNLAQCYQDCDEFAPAVALYRKALPAADVRTAVLNRIGACRAGLEDYAGALDAFNQSLTIDAGQDGIREIVSSVADNVGTSSRSGGMPDLSHLKQNMDLNLLNAEVSKYSFRVRWRFDGLMRLVSPLYRQMMSRNPGEHYAWLTTLARVYRPGVMLEFGRAQGASTLALYSGKPPAACFGSVDIARGDSLGEYFIPHELTLDDTVSVLLGDCLDLSLYGNLGFDPAQIDFLFVDVGHDGATEREFVRRVFPHLRQCLVLFDDIHLYAEMDAFWNDLPYPKLDITTSCHHSGSGLVWVE